MQDVCPEVVVDVVVDADECRVKMLSWNRGELKSKRVSWRKGKKNKLGKDTTTDFIGREQLLSVVLVVPKQLLKYLTEKRHKRCSLGIFQ
ncbi:hypothetical protein F2Q70_00002197 [Brassica cretica]|uniref:Uncharacterized protein n=1 Tax=Brassica cretica TaxID=69181 RepID=A0A8S9J476_BRACR|nr:hypothetical protein F2Q70_00002197 [Brassica cretica]